MRSNSCARSHPRRPSCSSWSTKPLNLRWLSKSLPDSAPMPKDELFSEREMFKPCVVIPVYNHERAVGSVVTGILAQRLPCILVDDGSGPACAAVLDGLAAATPEQITLLRHSVNRGKGGAVMT